MADLSNVLGGPWSPPSPPVISSPEEQLTSAMRSHGLTPPEHIHIDGKIHRFSTGDKRTNKDGWYVVFPGTVPSGRFGCWRQAIETPFRAEIGRDLSVAEQMAYTQQQKTAREAAEKTRRASQEATADAVATIWESGSEASPDHPYLKRKGIQPHGARVTGDGRLMLPLFDADGALSSIQYIDSSGNKLYQSGGAVSGCTYTIGAISDATPVVYLAEGFATAATIYEAIKSPTVIAYSANNLTAAAGVIRAMCPQTRLVIVADNDASGVGLNHANQAAAKHGATVIMPPDRGDANDYAQAGNDLAALLTPQQDDWLVQADDFSHQPAPLSWMVKHWIRSDGLMMVHGPSGGGKTFVVLDWVLSIAAGRGDWFGHRVTGGPVVYLAGEGHHGMRARIAGWKQSRQVSRLSMWLSRHGVDLNTPEGYIRTVSAIRTLPDRPRVIVVDTLHRFLAGDENSAQDAKTMLDACAGLMQEFGCIVILVHHTGVSDEAQHRARGSSAWKGALDMEVSIVPSKDGRPIEIIQRKSKDTELAEPMYCRLESIAINGWMDEDNEPVTTAVIEQESAPAPSNKSNKVIEKDIKLFERAWIFSGGELHEGNPYITKAAMMRYLEESEGITSRNSRYAYWRDDDARWLGRMLANHLARVQDDGLILVDETHASALMMVRQ